MPTGQPVTTPAKPAQAPPSWSALAHLLAPAAGCDCQMMAIGMADSYGKDASKTPSRNIAER